jgi:hypothetical protein
MIDEGEKNGWPHIMNLDLCDMGLFFVAKCWIDVFMAHVLSLWETNFDLLVLFWW